MYAAVNSLGVSGLNGYPVAVETDISGGLPAFAVVGLPDSAVRECGERVRSAIKNLRYPWPSSHVTVNLAPADVRKTGPLYDLPVFIGLLAAQGQLPAPAPHQAFLGELGLDGALRPIAGALPMALAAAKAGVRELFLPAENAAEAAVAEGLTVYPARTARQVVEHLSGAAPLSPATAQGYDAGGVWTGPDFADVRGQEEARRAPARVCWPSGCRAFCRRFPTPNRWRRRRCTRWRGWYRAAPGCCGSGPSAARTTASAPPPWPAAAASRGLAR